MINLRVVRQPGDKEIPCLACGQCCTYVGIYVPTPSSVSYASDLLWMTYHRVNLATDEKGEEWWVYVPIPCGNLREDLKCSVYFERPLVCRDHSPKACEVNPLPTTVCIQMDDPVAYLRVLRRLRPKVYRQLQARHYVPRELIARVEADDRAASPAAAG